jgi:DNA-binding response OmpR family regulator
MRRLLLSGPTGTVEIPAAAAAMLSALALAPGRRLASWQIVQAFGQNTDQYTAAALGVRMVRLRALMRAVGFEDNTIRSLRSDGYQLCVPVTIL